jgi:hypothetical protein
MPRLVYAAGFGLLLVAGAFLLTDWLLTPPPGATEANSNRIRPGMTLRRVERVLGGPPLEGGARGSQLGWWVGDAGLVAVEFDAAGRVTSAGFVPAAQFPRFRDALGLGVRDRRRP